MMNSVETANDRQSVHQSVGQSVGRSVSPRLVRIQKAKPQPNHTACATVRNWRNWTIIIKYHHFVTIKGIWKSFFPPISLLVLLCCRLLSFFILIQYRNSRTNQSRVETGSLWWGGGLLMLSLLPAPHLAQCHKVDVGGAVGQLRLLLYRQGVVAVVTLNASSGQQLLLLRIAPRSAPLVP